MKNIVRYLVVVLALVFLAGCAPKEMTKKLSKEYGEHLSLETTLSYKEKSDVVEKEEIKTIYKNMNADMKKYVKDEFSKKQEKLNIEGVESKLEETDNGIVTVVKNDYTKMDLAKVVEDKKMPEKLLSDDKKTVSLQKVEKDLKDHGFEEKTENK